MSIIEHQFDLGQTVFFADPESGMIYSAVVEQLRKSPLGEAHYVLYCYLYEPSYLYYSRINPQEGYKLHYPQHGLPDKCIDIPLIFEDEAKAKQALDFYQSRHLKSDAFKHIEQLEQELAGLKEKLAKLS